MQGRTGLRVFILAISLLLPTAAGAELPATVLEKLRAAGLGEDAIGVLVLRPEDGSRILAHNADASLQPGSTMKLVTTLTALEKLGPNWRGRTEARTTAPLEDGVLRGDLFLRGGLDIDFGWEELRLMIEDLRYRGVREIRGDLVVDLHLVRPSRLDVGLPPFDQYPERYYNPIPDALSLNKYLIRLDLVSNENSLEIRARPRLSGVSVVSDMVLVDRKCQDWEDAWKTPTLDRAADGSVVIRLQGEYPRNCTDYMRVNVFDRMEYIDRLFRTLWQEAGGTFQGTTRPGLTPRDARSLARRSSRPLGELVHDINKPSDNPWTRMLYLAMGVENAKGVEAEDDVATLVRSEQVVRGWFRDKGIAQEGLVLENGSGLSRTERVTPALLAALLQAGLRSDYAPEFMASLPIVGLDGTMARRLRGTPAAGRARIKTGTLDDAVAVAGYVPDTANRMRIVVAIVNAPMARRVAAPVVDEVINWVAKNGVR